LLTSDARSAQTQKRDPRIAIDPNHAVALQRKYYTDTAARYDSMHAHEGGTDASITQFVYAFAAMLEVRTILDVGTATAAGMRDLKKAMPHLFVCGVEPVGALVQQAVKNGNTASGPIVQATGEALPFANASFDAVCEFATLHHAANPTAVVEEMLRVARKAVFICDSNRFGQGSLPARLLKLALYKVGLWRAFNYLRTGGKGYVITEGDGLAYSFSVYDSLEPIHRWADRIILIPTTGDAKNGSWFHPLLTSSGILVCALKD
jgi:ubiquinone/menaquinone biosynthesis C-methylase UbiE